MVSTGLGEIAIGFSCGKKVLEIEFHSVMSWRAMYLESPQAPTHVGIVTELHGEDHERAGLKGHNSTPT